VVPELALEELETDVGPLRALLRPGMTAVTVGGNIGDIARLMAECVGPSGRVVAVEPDPGTTLDDVLPEHVDVIFLDMQASEHVALRGAWGILDRDRPVVLVKFWPQGLREADTDPVSVLDGYRAMGMRVTGAGRELPGDPGELVLAVDAAEAPFTTLRLDPVDPAPPAAERLLPVKSRLGRLYARRFPAAEEPGTLAYDAAHRALVASLLEDEEWRRIFAEGERLPRGLGYGFDERVVEYPWLRSRGPRGRVLDAGSVLNHRHVLERLLPELDELTICTLAPEPTAFTNLGVSYLYADLRDLPLRDGWFDEVVCLSTLEHVGMDNTTYGSSRPRADDPRAAAAVALRELLRVTRPGGCVHLSFPFGRREDHGWLRQLDRDDVAHLLAGAGVARHEEEVFAHTARGWRRTTARQARNANYNNGDPSRAPDGAVAARAVMCLTIPA
jgi:SAM-dependent methyltransferase